MDLKIFYYTESFKQTMLSLMFDKDRKQTSRVLPSLACYHAVQTDQSSGIGHWSIHWSVHQSDHLQCTLI